MFGENSPDTLPSNFITKKMKIGTIIIYLILLSFTGVSQNSFEVFIESDEDEVMNDAIEDNNGNFVLVGGVGDRILWEFDGLVAKIEPDGNYITRRFERSDTVSFLTEVVLLDDGNYMAFGAYSPIGDFDAMDHFWIIKLDAGLNTIFEKSFLVNGLYHYIAAVHTIIDESDNIIIAGEAYYYDPPNPYALSDMVLIKLNQNGDTLLTKYHHNQFSQSVLEFMQIPNSNDYIIIVEGNVNSISSSALNIRLDSVFNITGVDKPSSPDIYFRSQGSSDHWVSDSSYLYSASISYPDKKEKNETAIGVFEIDTNMNILQHQYFYRPDTIEYAAWKNSMAYANDTTIYIGGFQSVMNPWLNVPTILEIYVVDRELNLLGHKDYGADANNQLFGIMPTSDGGCLMYATRFDNEQGIPERDIRIIKLLREDIELEISPLTATPETLELIGRKPYPNPASQLINIPLQGYSIAGNKRISLFTIEGKKILDRKINGECNVIQIDIHSLTSGVYLYRVSTDGKEAIKGKFLKQ